MNIRRSSSKTQPHPLLLFCTFVVLTSILVTLALLGAAHAYRQLAAVQEAAARDTLNERMTALFNEINQFPRSAGDDVAFLGKLASAELADPDLLRRNLFSFLHGNTAYYRLAYVGPQGTTKILVEFDGSDYQDKTGREHLASADDWLAKTAGLNFGEVYVSQVYLEKMADGAAVPVLVYATPINKDADGWRGAIVAYIYADYFLEDVRRSQRKNELTFLVDSDGNYLAHPDGKREFSHLSGRKFSLREDYPEVADDILSSSGLRNLETARNFYSFRAIYPSEGSLAVYRGSKELEGSEKPYHWIMVTVSEKSRLAHAKRNITGETVIFLATLLIVATIMFIVANRLAAVLGKRKN